jgi:nucleoporin NUP42
MKEDFKNKPLWPLSSYGPGLSKNISPPLDESPEELRFKAVTAMRNGNISEYVRTLIEFYQTIP